MTAGQPVVIGGQTVSADGAAATVSGHLISVASTGVLVDGSAAAFSDLTRTTSMPQAPLETMALLTISGSTYTAYEIGSGTAVIMRAGSDPLTLSSSGSAATVAGQEVRIGSNGVLLGSSSIAFSTATATDAREAVFTVHGTAHTAVAQAYDPNVVVVDSRITLSVGGQGIVMEGQTISFASSGMVIDGTHTAPLSRIQATTPAVSATSTNDVEILPSSTVEQGISATGSSTASSSASWRLRPPNAILFLLLVAGCSSSIEIR